MCLGRRRLLPLLLAVAAAISGCPSPSDPPPAEACPIELEKQSVLDLATDWYLYPDLLAPVNPADYADSAALLRALVAPAVATGQDRGWSFVTTLVQNQQYYGAGEGLGFGFSVLVRSPSRLWLSQVYPGSSAANAGFVRGDEILEVGESEATLVPVSGLITSGTLTAALGPSEPGVTRTFRVAPLADPVNPVVRTVTKAVFNLNPVAYVGTVPAGTAGLPRDVGVVVLRTFISTAEAPLRAAFDGFRAAGITDVLVDLRYNGGGALSTAKVLANLMGGGLQGQTMYDLAYGAGHASLDSHVTFSPPAEAVTLTRAAFVTTGASASASELVPNVLEPYLAPSGNAPAIALIGARTYGKPVGQSGFNLADCGKVLYVVSFSLKNGDGEGGYFQGLPDAGEAPAFGGPLCPATDDLLHPQGAVGEASTYAALSWLANGTCPTTVAAAAAPDALSVAAPDEYPTPERPTLAQLENPGLF